MLEQKVVNEAVGPSRRIGWDQYGVGGFQQVQDQKRAGRWVP
jgi:hypothetical protein